MDLLVFVTIDRGRSTGPLLFLPDSPKAALPPHPRGLSWKYFATIGEDDVLLGDDKEAVLENIELVGHHVVHRVVVGDP